MPTLLEPGLEDPTHVSSVRVAGSEVRHHCRVVIRLLRLLDRLAEDRCGGRGGNGPDRNDDSSLQQQEALHLQSYCHDSGFTLPKMKR